MAMNNSLAEVHPELVSEWSEKNLPLTPDDITFGSNKKVWWKGACGHEWKTSVRARSNGENGCRYAEKIICISFIHLIRKYVFQRKRVRQKDLKRSFPDMKNRLLKVIG